MKKLELHWKILIGMFLGLIFGFVMLQINGGTQFTDDWIKPLGTIFVKLLKLIAIPLMIQTYGIFAISYFAAKKLKLPHNIAAPACMIATSNFFELAVAVAISLFGLHSGAALATVVGVLVEVPVMLSLVAFANRTKHYFK